MITSKHLHDGHEYTVYDVGQVNRPGCWQVRAISGELVAIIQQDEAGEYLHLSAPAGDAPALAYHDGEVTHDDVFDLAKGVL